MYVETQKDVANLITWAPIPEIIPMTSSQAQHHDANGPHLGPAKWAAQK